MMMVMVMMVKMQLFKTKFFLEYLVSWYGLVHYFLPGLGTRRRIMAELRSMFRASISEHRNTLDPNHPR